jgi:hypothetical protein
MSTDEDQAPTAAERDLLKLLELLRTPVHVTGRPFVERVVRSAGRQLLVRRVLEVIAALARAGPDTALTLGRSTRTTRRETDR